MSILRESWKCLPERLSFGIEQEHFVFKQGRRPSLSEMKEVFTELASSGFTIRKRDTDGKPLALGRDLPEGYLSVKNDFCTHILEVAQPPHHDPGALESVYRETWMQIEQVLGNHGIQIHRGGSIDPPPEDMVMIPHERLKWMTDRPKPFPQTELWHSYFTTLMCATQVHMNILDSSFYSTIPALYSLEYLFPLFFSNSPRLMAGRFHCARPLAWRDNFTTAYRAFAIPHPIPASKVEYDSLIKSSHNFVRDYCFIAPRAHGTVEFRSTCSQDSFDQIRQLVALRIAVVVASSRFSASSKRSTTEGILAFYQVCETGKVSPHLLSNDLEFLELAKPEIPRAWEFDVNRVLSKLRELLATSN